MSDFPRSQFVKLPYPMKSFAGQTIIVTGANVGLGLEAARHFTRLNAAKVILACRSISKGEEAAQSIEETTGRKGVCEVWQVDLGNFDSVKAFVQRAAKLDRLDIVCENAGIAGREYFEMEGMESMVAVNVVGTFLMALNLLPILRKSGKTHGTVPCLVITTSGTHFWVCRTVLFLCLVLLRRLTWDSFARQNWKSETKNQFSKRSRKTTRIT